MIIPLQLYHKQLSHFLQILYKMVRYLFGEGYSAKRDNMMNVVSFFVSKTASNPDRFTLERLIKILIITKQY